MNGIVLYRGPSMLDGKKIVCILTGLERRSKNEKTGDVLASWIMRDGIDPLSALRGEDCSVCGTCPHRPANNGTCYVNVAQAPLAIWRAYRAGTYARFKEGKHLPLMRDRILRLGSYGDPTAVPLDAWLPVLVSVSGHIGYTHQWRECDQDWRRFVMASVDSPGEREQAQGKGWRTFRIRPTGAGLLPGEFACPASPEGGNRRQCVSCQACDGATDSGRGASPAIIVHGPRNKVVPFSRISLL